MRLVRARRADRGECTHALFLDPRAPVRLDREVRLREPLRVVGERGREEVVRRPVDEVARRVEMARDDRLPLDQLAQLVACGDRDRQFVRVAAAALVEAGVVRAEGRALDDRSRLLRRRERRGTRRCSTRRHGGRRAARARRGDRGAECVGVERRGRTDADGVVTAAHLARRERRVDARTDVGAGRLPDLDPHIGGRCYRGTCPYAENGPDVRRIAFGPEAVYVERDGTARDQHGRDACRGDRGTRGRAAAVACGRGRQGDARSEPPEPRRGPEPLSQLLIERHLPRQSGAA